MKHIKRALAALVLLIVAAAGTLYWMGTREDAGGGPPASGDAASLAERGRYLALAGNCMACHTSRGGKPYAGGTPVPTPFGVVYGPNLTPDSQTGIGAWSADDFWRALHNGKSRDGTLLYPAFPYTEYTRMTRADADALYAFLRTVEPVNQPNRPAEMEFPYNQRALLAFWRALYFAGHAAIRRRPVGALEPRPLSGRGAGPLRGLPYAAQQPGRHARGRAAGRRRDSGAGLVRAAVDQRPEHRHGPLAGHGHRGAAQDRHRRAFDRHGADGRGGEGQHAVPER